MHSVRALAALVLLLATPAVSRISPYNPDDNLRPDNVTGLDYKYYDKIGSYYNGTLTLKIQPKYNPTRVVLTGESCFEFENKTLEIPMAALAGFQEVAPEAPSRNPFFLYLTAWDEAYNLTNQYQTANYSDYGELQINTYPDVDNNATFYFNVSNPNDTSLWYNFHGRADPSLLIWQDFYFNASDYCDPVTSLEDDLLFKGVLLAPEPRVDYDWAENPIPIPTIRGGINENQAWTEIWGLFRATSGDTELVGEITLDFRGEVDDERSDQLFMGRKTPEWNATLGFDVGSVGGAESAASVSSPRMLGVVALLAGVMALGMV